MADKDVSQTRFDFNTGESIDVSFVDFGAGGIQLKIVVPEGGLPGYWRESSLGTQLESKQVDEFIRWLCQTKGRAANCLPEETLGVLEAVLSSAQHVSTKNQKVIVRAIRVLRDLDEQSKVQRALDR